MDTKLLLSILNRPWCIEPQAAEYYREFARQLFASGVPLTDKRAWYTSVHDFKAMFRVDEAGNINHDGAVQVIRINYPIAKYDYCGDPGTQTLQQLLAAVNADPGIRSIVMWLDCPGGTVDGTEALATDIRNSSKPVIAYSDRMMASGGYWLGSSAKEVIVHGANNGWNAVIGSIGTIAFWEDHTEKKSREGIKTHIVTAPDSVDKWKKALDANAGNYEKLTEELAGLNDTFLAAVKTNRAGKIDLAVENVLTGKTYNAKEALKYGLIDKIGDFQFAVKRSLQLARQASKQSTATPMAKFPKTLAAAKAAADFEVMNEGIWLTEDQLSSVEASLAQHETAAATAATQAAVQQHQIDTLTTQAANDQQTITDLRAQVEKLSKADAGRFSDPGSQKEDDDDASNGADDPNLSMNQHADRLLRRR